MESLKPETVANAEACVLRLGARHARVYAVNARKVHRLALSTVVFNLLPQRPQTRRVAGCAGHPVMLDVVANAVHARKVRRLVRCTLARHVRRNLHITNVILIVDLESALMRVKSVVTRVSVNKSVRRVCDSVLRSVA